MITANIKVQEQLKNLVAATLDEIQDVKYIYLFGSYAYGKPDKNSDFDLMVITEKEKTDVMSLLTEIRYKTINTVDDFDMLVYSEQVFNRRKKHYPLEKKISDDGVLLYERI